MNISPSLTKLKINNFKPSTKTHDLKKFEICGDEYESEKDMNDSFIKRHKNSSDPFILKWSNDKLLGLAMAD